MVQRNQAVRWRAGHPAELYEVRALYPDDLGRHKSNRRREGEKFGRNFLRLLQLRSAGKRDWPGSGPQRAGEIRKRIRRIDRGAQFRKTSYRNMGLFLQSQ